MRWKSFFNMKQIRKTKNKIRFEIILIRKNTFIGFEYFDQENLWIKFDNSCKMLVQENFNALNFILLLEN